MHNIIVQSGRQNVPVIRLQLLCMYLQLSTTELEVIINCATFLGVAEYCCALEDCIVLLVYLIFCGCSYNMQVCKVRYNNILICTEDRRQSK